MQKFKKIGEFIANSKSAEKKILEILEKQGFPVLIDEEYVDGIHYIIME